jgi:hypothetical protein
MAFHCRVYPVARQNPSVMASVALGTLGQDGKMVENQQTAVESVHQQT